jgi:PAT family acetyl-CoA transporter-like MFS transporter 1
MGHTLGFFVSFNLFMELNSVTFCNKYIWSTPKEYPLLTHSQFLFGVAITVLIFTLIVHFLLSDIPAKREGRSLWSSIKLLSCIWKSKEIGIFCIWCIFRRAGTTIVEATFAV